MSNAYKDGDQLPEASKIPTLSDWSLLEFSESGLSLSLNFSAPLYVSVYNVKDSVSFKVLNPKLFTALTD